MGDHPLAVITGGSSGIGRALALQAAERGMDAVLIGRNRERLGGTARECRRAAVDVRECALDLTDPDAADRVLDAIDKRPVDLCVLAAGTYHRGRLGDTDPSVLDEMFTVNVVAAFRTLRALLPALRRGPGNVVFVNSTQGRWARPCVGALAASQHALRGLADALRAEEYAAGIRVLTVYVGRTATPRQERIFAAEGREWTPELLLQPKDVAEVILHATSLPRSAEVSELTILPMWKG